MGPGGGKVKERGIRVEGMEGPCTGNGRSRLRAQVEGMADLGRGKGGSGWKSRDGS